MLEKIAKGLLVLILTGTVVLGAYLGFNRYLIELQDRTVELCVDFNDLASMAAYEKKPIDKVLAEIKKCGITSIGLYEVTLPDENVLGDLYYTKGSAIQRLGDFNPTLAALNKRGLIKPDRTYIYVPQAEVRRRVFNQLSWITSKNNIHFLGKEILEVNEAESELRAVGLGLSEQQKKLVLRQGFAIIPRVWNDPRYHFGNIGLKIAQIKDCDTIIFDGEDILGYPQALGYVAEALKTNKINYGYIEIVKQDGDQLLRRLMDRNVVRVHSVPKRELTKLKKADVITRFVRAARERKVRLIYMRPFLPPQIEAYPVSYNLKYFAEVTQALQQNGFIIGKAGRPDPFRLEGWQITGLGIGVAIGGVFLLSYLFGLHFLLMYLLVILAGAGLWFASSLGYNTALQKGLALLAAIIFPALAVASSFARKPQKGTLLWNSILIVLNIVAESLIGVFLLVGLLADHRFMLGVEVFKGVKLALVVPIFLVALYFILRQGKGSIRERIKYFLNTEIKMFTIFAGLFVLAALGLFVARSGNFVMPVLFVEKYFRKLLEVLLFIRPRTKEFMVGYPLLFLAATMFLRGREKWLWVIAALGAIAPISILNTFSHIHTPLMVSAIRTLNGLVLGIIIGIFVVLAADYFIKKKTE